MTYVDRFFQDFFYEKQEKSKKMLDDFLLDSSETQIHNLRKSIRKLESAYSIIPNSSKRKKTDNFVFSYRVFFKKISFIRDLDVILEKLEKNGLEKENEIIKIIARNRDRKLKNMTKKAKKLSKLECLNLKKIETDKATKKHNRRINSLLDKIEKSIPIVISDESKIDELHRMRKTTKKLRYVLEAKREQSYQPLVNTMKTFQKLLGDIHDCDIAIDFLKQHSEKHTELKHIISKETELRDQSYLKLTSISDKTI